MKKAISIILAFALIFAFAPILSACGKGGDTLPNKKPDKAPETIEQGRNEKVHKMIGQGRNDDYEYAVYSDDTVELLNYHGKRIDVIIPDNIDSFKVISIGWAFQKRIYIESIIIPDSVTTIDNSAFSGCNSLSEETKQRILQINPDAEF